MSASMVALRIAHISDLHIARRPTWRETTFKRLAGYANFKINRGFHHREELIARAVERLSATPVTLVVVTGDLAQTGLDEEFRVAEQLLAPLSKAGIPVIACDGNHDLYGNSSRDSWLELRARLLLHLRPDEYGIFRFPGLDLLPMDQGMESPPFFSCGRVDRETLERAGPAWRGFTPGTVRIVCGHYPVMGKKGIKPRFFYGLKGWRSLLEFLRLSRVSAYLCGHYHKRNMTSLGGGVVQYAAPALSVDGRVDLFDSQGGEFDYQGAV